MKLRQGPSGPFLTNDGGAPLDFGDGARLRMVDLSQVIPGPQFVPTAKTTIKAAGFTGVDADALTLTLTGPKPGARYAAELTFDVVNDSTNTDASVNLYLDVSVDDGTTWTEFAASTHRPPSASTASPSGRQVSLHLPLGLGSALGVLPDSPSLKIRSAASQPTFLGGVGSALASPDTAGSSTTSKGSFYLRLEECF